MALRFALRIFAAWLMCLAAASAQVPLPDALPDGALPANNRPLLQLGPGDQLRMDVFGRPEMDSTMYVGDDGTIRVPLAGPVAVNGLSPAQAGQKVEEALKKGQILVDPHVTFTVLVSRSQRVSVMGAVHAPGRYPVESNTTILDLLAQAGGATDKSSSTVYILRPDAAGALQRIPVDLGGGLDSQDGSTPAALQTVRAGDALYVPTAAMFYMAGEVHTTGAMKLDAGMTVLQAIARAGGVTERGSTRRVSIKRKTPQGGYTVISAKPEDKIQPDDVLTVKERLF
ncbi:MAG: SLBB domain-containing protein [Proteobacteria bacterium]|nr:SLBB domain-containing protein [Pseudomonadota bacterium]